MSAGNIVAHELEAFGVRTFSAKEMAFNILGLMHPLLFSITQVEPIWADLNGGMARLPDLSDITTRIRANIHKKSDLCRAITQDNSADFRVMNGVEAERLLQTVDVVPRANFRFEFPALALVCTAEALIMSGITNPYELYKHMHSSHLVNCVGSGMGGSESLAGMFSDRRVQSDILQEM